MGTSISDFVRDFVRSRRAKCAAGCGPAAAAARGRLPGAEALERRVLLSGETVTSALGAAPLPAGRQLQVTFRATVAPTAPKGVDVVYGSGTVSGTNFASVATDDAAVGGTTDPTATALDRAPQVRAVFVRSSGWGNPFLTGLQAAGLGSATLGYAVPAGAGQLASVSWGGIDRVSVRFDKNVSVAGDDLQLFAAAGGPLGLATAVSYDPATFTATWSLAGGPVANDKLRVVVASGAAGVVAAGTGGQQLDGEWADAAATAFNSGNGIAGGDFSLRLNVAAGDVNGDGVVNTTDGVLIRGGLSPAAYQPRLDVNADGVVNTTDFVLYRPLIGTALPAADPAGAAAGGWVAATTPTAPVPSGVAGTASTLTALKSAALATDVNGDGNADLGDTLRYTVAITNTSGGNLNGVTLTDTLSPYLTLVGGSVSASPVLADDADAAALAYAENAAAAVVLPNLLVGDGDGTITAATVGVSGWVSGQDALTFGSAAGVTPTYDAATGSLTFAGTATPAVYQALLRSVAYGNTSETPATTARTLSVTVGDGTTASNAVTRGIAVTAVNDAPALANLEGAAVTYNQNTGAVSVTDAITASDADNANLAGATVTISGGYVNGQDALSVSGALPAGITAGAFNAAAGSLTLTGSAPLASYQAALRQVRFANTAGSATSKTISFRVDDGAAVNNLSNAVARSVSINLAPTVVGETFAAVGNTQFLLGVAPGSTAAAVMSGTVLGNDLDPAPASNPITINSTGAASSGTVAMNADGTFTYTPAAGFVGAATFTYTVRDGLGAISQPATVTLNVASKVWYVNNAAAAGGDGRSNTPFDSLADVTGAAGADAAGDVIFIHTGSGTYDGGVTLLNNQMLWGQNESLTVGSYTLQAAGADPTLVNTAASGNGVTLASGNTLKGFTVGDTNGFDLANTPAASVGTLTAVNVVLTGTGGLVNIDSGGTLNVTLDSAGTTAATGHGVNLVNTGGTFAATAGALSGVAGTDLRVEGTAASNTVAVAFAPSITSSAGGSVEVGHHAAGAITVTGALTVTGGTGVSVHDNVSGTITFSNASKVLNTGAAAAVNLAANTGATVNFTGGGLDVDTTSGSGFTATGGGTVSVQGTGNTIDSIAGTALNVTGTTIGAPGLTFQRVSSGGPASSAGNGITLDNTGTSAGLTVTGTGAAGSGGTIQRKTGADSSNTAGTGVYLNNTTNVSLSAMQLNDFDNFAIRGKNVTNFSLVGSTVSGSSGTSLTADDEPTIANGEDSVRFTNLLGSAAITNCNIGGGFENTVRVINDTGTLDRLTISGSTILNARVGGDDALLFETRLSAVGRLAVDNCDFTAARGDLVNTSALNASTMGVVITNSRFSNNHTAVLGGGVTVAGGSVGGNIGVTYNIANNTFRGARGPALNVSQSAGAGTWRGTITGNTVGVSGVANSGTIDAAAGILHQIFGNNGTGGASTTVISNNTIQRYGEEGILLRASQGNSTLNATVTGNLVREPNSPVNTFAGLWADVGGLASDTNTINLALGSFATAASQNTLAGSGPAGDVALSTNFNNPNTTLNVSRLGSTSNVLATVIQDNNVGSPTVITDSNLNRIFLVNTVPPTLLVAATGGVAAAKPAPAAALRQSDLNAIKSAAILRWQKAGGLTAKQVAALKAVSFQISDLAGQTLGSATGGNRVVIDADAAGRGWYVDATPADDKEFAVRTSAARLYAKPTAAPAGRMDLLTAVMHELGHVLGLGHDDGDRDDLMFDALATGERRLPAATGAVR